MIFFCHRRPCLLFVKNFLFWKFRGWKVLSFLGQNIDGNRFTDYWKGSCFELFRDGKYGTVFFRARKCLGTFPRRQIRLFFQPKSCGKDDIYLVFFSFSWYSRTWWIWIFMQLKLKLEYKFLYQLFQMLLPDSQQYKIS